MTQEQTKHADEAEHSEGACMERASARLINEIARDLHGFRVVVVISGVRAKLAT